MSAALDPMTKKRHFVEGLFREDSSGSIRLVGTRCGQCQALAFPARAVCASCGRRNLARIDLGPYGTLYTFAVIHQAPAPFATPYAIGYVDLDEGVRVFTQLEEFDSLVLGQRMELIVGRLYSDSDGTAIFAYKFRPDRDEG